MKDLPLSFDLIVDPSIYKTELMYYEQFYHEVENLFVDKDKELQEKISRKLKDIPEKHHDEFVEDHGFDLHQNQFMFPAMHRESIFITIYNHLEHSLNSICNKMTRDLNGNIKLKDLHGAGVERAILYLRKIPEFDFSKINTVISYIRSTNRLRNFIVHNGGSLPENKSDKIFTFIDQQKSIYGEPGGSIFFSEEFIPEYIKELEKIYTHIADEMQRFLDKYRT